MLRRLPQNCVKYRRKSLEGTCYVYRVSQRPMRTISSATTLRLDTAVVNHGSLYESA